MEIYKQNIRLTLGVSLSANEITAGELHSYVQTNVIQQSSGSQTPVLQGDATKVRVCSQ